MTIQVRLSQGRHHNSSSLACLTNLWAGGKKILQRVAGKDASKQFWKYHNEGILKKYKGQLQIGSLDTKPKAEPKLEAKPASAPTPVAAPKSAPAKKPVTPKSKGEEEALEPFGAQIPFSDPSWYHGVSFLHPILP